MARRDYFIDESRPIVGPLLLEDRNEDQVELIQKRAFTSELFF
jgi:hypothetical protein